MTEPDIFAKLRAMYDMIEDVQPVEPVHLTRAQLDWLKKRLPERPKQRYGIPDPSPLLDTPIHLVETVEESTPYVKGWASWPGTPHQHLWQLNQDGRRPTRCAICQHPVLPWWLVPHGHRVGRRVRVARVRRTAREHRRARDPAEEPRRRADAMTTPCLSCDRPLLPPQGITVGTDRFCDLDCWSRYDPDEVATARQQWNAEETRVNTERIECPLDDCTWSMDATPPDTLGRNMPAEVYGMLHAGHAQRVEHDLRQHFATHEATDFLSTIQRLRTELAKTEADRDRYRKRIHEAVDETQRRYGKYQSRCHEFDVWSTWAREQFEKGGLLWGSESEALRLVVLSYIEESERAKAERDELRRLLAATAQQADDAHETAVGLALHLDPATLEVP